MTDSSLQMEPPSIRVVEVGPRDGLQNEPTARKLPLASWIELRLQLLIRLAQAGFEDVEAGAFVRADRVPQMEGTAELLQLLRTGNPDLWARTRFWVLVPNQKGLDLALAAGARHVSVFTAASDEFNQRNVLMSVAKSLDVLRPVVAQARQAGLGVRGYVSTAWGCPYSGRVEPARVRDVAESLLDFGAEEISLGDTIGVATPRQVDELLQEFPDKTALAVHFHDTRGTAIANSLRAIELGVRSVDSSVGGLGGCPYAKGASGNLASEDLLYMLHGMGFRTRVSLEQVCEASDQLSKELGLNLPSRMFKAWKGSSVGAGS